MSIHRRNFLQNLTKLVDEYERSTPLNNDITIEIEFFDGSIHIWNGERFVQVCVPYDKRNDK